METNQLLQQAREAFIRKFTQTPEELGYLEANVYKNDVLFTTSKEVFDAFVKAQALIKKVISQLFGFAFLIILLTAVIIYAGNISNSTLSCISAAAVIITLIIAIVVNYSRFRQCNEWEALYTKKGNVLIFDGQFFDEPKPEPVYPETAFF